MTIPAIKNVTQKEVEKKLKKMQGFAYRGETNVEREMYYPSPFHYFIDLNSTLDGLGG
jgi:hypothetical protein